MDFTGLGNSTVGGIERGALRDEQNLRESKTKRNENLGEQFDRLSLITNAMWELLQEAWPALTVEHLQAKMHEIDGRDGLYDGSTHRPPVPCPSPTCNAKVPVGQPRCQFCGAEIAASADPFAF